MLDFAMLIFANSLLCFIKSVDLMEQLCSQRCGEFKAVCHIKRLLLMCTPSISCI